MIVSMHKLKPLNIIVTFVSGCLGGREVNYLNAVHEFVILIPMSYGLRILDFVVESTFKFVAFYYWQVMSIVYFTISYFV